MQSYVGNMDIEEEESLFGSPPTSPRIASRPPAQLQLNFTHLAGQTWSPQASTPSTPSSSRASSQGPSQSKGKRGKRRRADDEPLIRRPPPEILLPDPTAPVPPNWLRSQSALLGHAGLVGGVKPATLSNRHSRGSTSVNPIVIDDDQCEHSSGHCQPGSHHMYPNLPTPPIDEIVQILIRQREIFPLLQGILDLMETGSLLSQHNTSAPAFKKRKLSTAAAWEALHSGEGSCGYRDRGKVKQLISQLVSLIKSASRTAALRTYLAKDRSSKLLGSKEAGLIKELEHAMPKDILTDASNSPVKSSNPSAFPPVAPESSPFDDLLASLLTVNTSSRESGDSSSSLSSLFANTTHESTPELDQAVLDNWISIFETFQMSNPSEQTAPLGPASFSASALQGASLQEADSNCQATSLGFPNEAASFPDFSLDFNSWTMFPTVFPIETQYQESPAHSVDLFSPTAGTGVALQSFPPDLAPNMNPDQLNISIPSPSYPSSFSASSSTPSLVYSPILSSSSFGDAELRMPLLPRAELYTPDNSTAAGQGEDGLFNNMIDGMGQDGNGDILMGLVEGRQDHEKTQATPDFSVAPLSAFLPALVAATVQSRIQPPAPPVSAGTSSVFTPPAVRPFQPSDRSSNKAELLKRARERRAQLAEEVVKARTQLWETTIEHGVLTRLAKLYT